MDYIYVFVIPIVILIISYFVNPPKDKSGNEYLTLGLKTLPYWFGYGFFLYYLEMEHNINGITLAFFIWWIPIAGVLIGMKVIFFIIRYLDKIKQKKG